MNHLIENTFQPTNLSYEWDAVTSFSRQRHQISYERPDLPEVMSKKMITSSAHLIVHSRWLKGRRLDLKTASDPDLLTKTPSLIYQADGHLLQEWLTHLKIGFPSIRVSAIVQDWRIIQTLVSQGHGYGIVPSYVEGQSKEVRRVELPKSVLLHFVFYATFYRDLKGIPAFARVLERLALPKPFQHGALRRL